MQFPTNLVAGLAKAEPAELWEIEDAGERAVPQVDLSMKAEYVKAVRRYGGKTDRASRSDGAVKEINSVRPDSTDRPVPPVPPLRLRNDRP